ncbi:hypothetical protein EV138_2643 [Kribbella voronezhensis]|uniref:Uncharacterized protein n=1 Tax=Kribbella voronezhensis TaxID=2512212 RepID=A0A4R7TCK3_9ACTN|nr:hypothetical protein EV138_2643 [Kribbella voronezhensis]
MNESTVLLLEPRKTEASRTIDHQLSVLFGFYEWACSTGAGRSLTPCRR